MPAQGEFTYYSVIGELGRQHAIQKPFSQPDCGGELLQVGQIFSLLPPPPARILECGCGTGWLTFMLEKHGYKCVGADAVPDVIEMAKQQAIATGSKSEFIVADMEKNPFKEEFDAVIYYDSLHHCLDEGAAITGAYNALKKGGICITSEPGNGHAKNSAEVVAKYGVTEKDMPSRHIVSLGRKAGFTDFKRYPRMDDLGRFCHKPKKNHPIRNWMRTRLPQTSWLFTFLKLVKSGLFTLWILDNPVVVMKKS